MEVNYLPKTFVILLFILFQEITFAQLGVNATNTPPASNATLNISSTTKASNSSHDHYSTYCPYSQGLTVFDIITNSYWYSNGTIWVNMAFVSSVSPWITYGNDTINSNTGNIGRHQGTYS